MVVWDTDSLWVGLYACSAYSLVKFLSYPALVLPDDVANIRVMTVWGSEVTLQDGLVLAFNLAFFVGKIPAVYVISSPLYYQNRFAVMSGLSVATGLLLGLPLAIAPHFHGLQIAGMFLSSLHNAWIFGGVVSYLEGRRSTELLIAAIGFTFIVAGALAKCVAQAVLSMGCDPYLMPLLLSGTCLVPCIFLFWKLDSLPPPSEQDQRERTVRKPMSSDERSRFMSAHAFTIAMTMLAYTLAGTLRSYRDQFSRQIFSSALGHDPSSSFFFLVDLPGAVTSSVMLLGLNRIKNHRRGLIALLVCMLMGCVLLLLNSLLHRYQGAPPGILWQILAGIGIYVAYQNTPVYERIVAMSKQEGTCSFLVFISDCTVYIGTVSLVLWKIFSNQDDDAAARTFDTVTMMTMAAGSASLAFLVTRMVLWKPTVPVDVAVGKVDGLTDSPLLAPVDEDDEMPDEIDERELGLKPRDILKDQIEVPSSPS